METLYHVLWELVHVFFEHRGLLAGRDSPRDHDAGASSFLYPFLAETEHDLEQVVADVRRSIVMKSEEIGELRTQTLTENWPTLVAAAATLRRALDNGGTLLALGNGGSATDAMDVVADFRSTAGSRTAWPAIDLTEDTGIVTAIANDIGPEAIFSRQVIAYGRAGDALLALSTSGNSGNIIAALAEARGRGLVTIAMVGYDGGRIESRAARRPRRGHPLTAHPAHPGGAGERLSRAARARRAAARRRRPAVSTTAAPTAARDGRRRRARVRVQGTVQGVGFRPYVYRLARELGLDGHVLNDARGVLLEAEGSPAAVEALLARLAREAPPLAVLETVACEALPPTGERGFAILESAAGGSADASVTPDTATCTDCLRELVDPDDRRFRYPFLNCTNCGPRFTIVAGIPYDRPLTTMAGFAMCPECRAEYDDPADRRFHAQPNACPRCGPTVALVDVTGAAVGWHGARDAVQAAARALCDGWILALKGIGGYHLACRADDEAVVARLRERKHREDKPFALMAADAAAAESLVILDATARAALTSPERPIVLAPRRDGSPVAPSVALDAPELGAMLPYSALHHLLLGDTPVPLVMTSGNVSDEPICFRDEEALARLAEIADLFVLHDRPIETRTDDSVVRVVALPGGHRTTFLRRSRGYVPASIPLPGAGTGRPLLACGAELKNTFCVARGRRAWVGHHIGDLRNLETLQSFVSGIEHFQRLFAVEPEVVAHDLHPEYLSTKYALEREGIELVGVQHHHAHLAACLAEHGESGKAIGAIYDGTGYGPDGTVWGGELLYGDVAEFRRVGSLRAVRLPGGERAIRQPWRMAGAWLVATGEAEPPLPAGLVGRVRPEHWSRVVRLARTGVASPLTTSAGRLFDAVAALCGLRAEINYEGQAAIELEARCDPLERGRYPMSLTVDGDRLSIDPAETIVAVGADVAAGQPLGRVATRFHNALARTTVAACARAASAHDTDLVVLSGGVFANRRLLETTAAGIVAAGLRVLTPQRLPAGDGGISYGQAAVAARRIGD